MARKCRQEILETVFFHWQSFNKFLHETQFNMQRWKYNVIFVYKVWCWMLGSSYILPAPMVLTGSAVPYAQKSGILDISSLLPKQESEYLKFKTDDPFVNVILQQINNSIDNAFIFFMQINWMNYWVKINQFFMKLS